MTGKNIHYDWREVETLKARLIERGLDLYNFGDGVTIMPVPNFEREGTYLATQIIGVIDPTPVDGKYRMMPVQFPHLSPSVRFAHDLADRIVAAFPKYSTLCEDLDSRGRVTDYVLYPEAWDPSEHPLRREVLFPNETPTPPQT